MISKSKYYIIIYSVITLLLISFSINPQVVQAETNIFSDNFNDGFIPEWESHNYIIEDSGSFSPIGQLSILPTGEEIKISGSGNYDTVTIDNKTVGNIGSSLIYHNPVVINEDITISTDARVVSGDINYEIVIFMDFNSNNRIALDVQSTLGGKFAQLVFDEGNNLRCPINDEEKGCNSQQYNFSNNESINLKISVDSETKIVNAYINNQNIATGTYKGQLGSPYVGFATTMFGKNHIIDSRFDNFVISSTYQNSSLNVPDIKQFSMPWGTMEYDSSIMHGLNPPTIARWGCAITSAAMILQYYGYQVSPGELNTWLNQNNGYSRSGGVLWPSIFKYTKDKSEGIKPLLEFSYHSPDVSLITNEIDSGHPPILKMQKANGNTHFMVATGKKGAEDFTVNDPASESDKINLMSQSKNKWGENVKIGTFAPSHSDGSYIVLLVDKDFNLLVSSESAEIKGDDYYFQDGPYIDPNDPDAEPELDAINSFYYPKPSTGKYKLEVHGEGNYQLNSYLYDRNSNPTTDIITGTLASNQPDIYFLYIDDDLKYIFPDSNIQRFTYLDVNLQNAFKNGKIKNKDLFDSLGALIRNAFRQYSNDKKFSPKILLNVALAKIRFNTPNLIDDYYSQILQHQIQILIDSI